MTTGALDRLIRRSASRDPRSPDRCELCGGAVADGHAHVLDEQRREALCACRACALLFERDEAGHDRYRLIPRRRLRLAGLSPTELGVPVGLAFFVREPDGTVVAHYPSPLGATRWEVDRAAWSGAVERCAPLRSMRPLVEALLVGSIRKLDEQWLVPVDECYRLVALIRQEWRGMSGGQTVWGRIEGFFHELANNGESGGIRSGKRIPRGNDGSDPRRQA